MLLKRDVSFVPRVPRSTYVAVTCPCSRLHRYGALLLLLSLLLLLLLLLFMVFFPLLWQVILLLLNPYFPLFWKLNSGQCLRCR